MLNLKCVHLLLQLLLLVTLTTLMSVSGALDFKYHKEKRLEKTLRNFTLQFPNMTKMYSIGKSVRGRDLWVIAIGKHVHEYTPLVPNVKYIANMHGNEVVGREMLLHLADHFLQEYGKNESLTEFLDTTTLHLMPCMNPDGFAISRMSTCDGIMGRANAMGYDLNRNFPDGFVTNPYPEQKETTLVKNWIHSTHFVLSANLHGGAMVVNYPYDAYPGDFSRRYSASPDDDVFRFLSLTYSQSHPRMRYGTSCGDSFKDGITNGAMWYSVIGGMQDYMYRNANGYEVLVEISCCKYPSESRLNTYWDQNRDALINYIFSVHMGVKGLIMAQSEEDESVLKPVENATVAIKGREAAAFTSSKHGEYYKLLLPGDYVLIVSHPNYQEVEVEFTVNDSAVTRLDITLFNNSSIISISMSSSNSSNITVDTDPRNTAHRSSDPLSIHLSMLVLLLPYIHICSA